MQGAAYYDGLSADEFFDGYPISGPAKEPGFLVLDSETRTQIIAAKFGLSAEDFKALPSVTKSDMILGAAGKTYASGTAAGIDAAEKDGRINTVKAFFAGSGFGGLVILLFAGVVLVPLLIGSKAAK